jgi:hypothetical protein
MKNHILLVKYVELQDTVPVFQQALKQTFHSQCARLAVGRRTGAIFSCVCVCVCVCVCTG